MAIGVFDSGVGGLTVHRRLVDRFPQADLIYLADQANTPYGGREGEEIVDLTRAGCEALFDRGCDLWSWPATLRRAWPCDACNRPGCPAIGRKNNAR